MAKAFMCDDCGKMFEGVPFKGNPITRVEDDVLTVEVFTTRCKSDLCEECTTKRLRAVLKGSVMTEGEGGGKNGDRKAKEGASRVKVGASYNGLTKVSICESIIKEPA